MIYENPNHPLTISDKNDVFPEVYSTSQNLKCGTRFFCFEPSVNISITFCNLEGTDFKPPCVLSPVHQVVVDLSKRVCDFGNSCKP
jgi:hypothetical protein